jgi:hypothetical protein
MSRNGSGVYSLVAGNPVVTGQTISSTWANQTLADLATALTNSWCVDGQTTVTANIPMSSFKFTGLGAGTVAGDSLMYGQALNGSSLALAGTITGATDVTYSGAMSGGTAAFSGALSGTTGAFTGAVTGVTATAGDGSTKFATCAFVVATAMSAILPGQLNSAGKYLTTDGANANWGNPNGVDATSKTANYNAAAGDQYPQDTTSAGFTVTLPTTPLVTDAPILVADLAGTFAANNLTLDPGANKVEGSAGTFLVDINRFRARLSYSGATQGWIFL